MLRRSAVLLALLSGSCAPEQPATLADLAHLAPGWRGTIAATVDQSYVGWDVEIGDADNDGLNEILTTGAPDSRLYLTEWETDAWSTQIVADNLARTRPSMGLAVKVVDLNADGQNEVVVGTGQEDGGAAFLHVLRRLPTGWSTLTSRPAFNRSSYTHNLAIHDLDQDGNQEILSSYCSQGEVIRYDVDSDLTRISARFVTELSGSGEESLLADIDNDGQLEYLVSNGFRPGEAAVEMFELDPDGELILPPAHILRGFDGKGCFYASITVGDLDNDGGNEVIVAWKEKQEINRGTILAYSVDATGATLKYRITEDDPTLDLSYFEKMMQVADVDNDGANELVLSTRGDGESENIESQRLGNVFQFKLGPDGSISRTHLVDFDDRFASSSWLAVGDCDNDGRNELVLATGHGDRRQPGTSYVIVVEKDGNP